MLAERCDGWWGSSLLCGRSKKKFTAASVWFALLDHYQRRQTVSTASFRSNENFDSTRETVTICRLFLFVLLSYPIHSNWLFPYQFCWEGRFRWLIEIINDIGVQEDALHNGQATPWIGFGQAQNPCDGTIHQGLHQLWIQSIDNLAQTDTHVPVIVAVMISANRRATVSGNHRSWRTKVARMSVLPL